jgi:hypothetical protein
MRLGQLARKLGVTSNQIVSFLASKSITIEEGANTRIESNNLKLVVLHFAPAMLSEIEKEGERPPIETALDPLPEKVEVPVESPIIAETPPSIDEQSAMLDMEKPSNFSEEKFDPIAVDAPPEVVNTSETIKAQKVELQGLKVVGKIDLPVPKKKETETSKPSSESEGISDLQEEAKVVNEKPVYKDRRPSTQRRSDSRPRKNPIQAQREREAQEAEEKRRLEAEKEKERRTQNYLKKVKPTVPTKAVKLIEEPVGSLQDEQPDEPKSLWGKFVRWLTT